MLSFYSYSEIISDHYIFLFSYNRQFRYEERNGEGYLKGRYGFFDKYGDLKVVNYSADPYAGFHAQGAGVPKYPH